MSALLLIFPLVLIGGLAFGVIRVRSMRSVARAAHAATLTATAASDAPVEQGDLRASRERLSSTYAETPQALARKSQADG